MTCSALLLYNEIAEQLLEIHEGRFGNTVSIDMLEEMCRSNNIKMDLEGVQKIVEEQKVLPLAVILSLQEQIDKEQLPRFSYTVIELHHIPKYVENR